MFFRSLAPPTVSASFRPSLKSATSIKDRSSVSQVAKLRLIPGGGRGLNLNKTRAFSTDGDNSNNLNPAVVYDNTDIQKELILKDNQRKAGVYR